MRPCGAFFVPIASCSRADLSRNMLFIRVSPTFFDMEAGVVAYSGDLDRGEARPGGYS